MATLKVYGTAIGKLASGAINYPSATVKAMLVNASYTPDQDAHDFIDDVNTYQIPGTGGYTTGGITLTSKTSTYNSGTNVHSLGCATISIATATVSFRYVVIYVDTGSAATSPLLGYIDYGSLQSATAQTMNIIVPAGGLIQFTVA